MTIKDMVSGKLVKIIGKGPTEETLKILHSDGTIQIQFRNLLKIIKEQK